MNKRLIVNVNTANNILALADQCVKCGLCLAQCPTYQLSRNENESPRGRIALIQAMASEQLPSSVTLHQHLDHCLQCRRCERVCPSLVEYGAIMQQARQQFPELNGPTPWLAQQGLKLVKTSRGQAWLSRLLRFYQVSGLQAVMRATGLLKLVGLAESESRLPTLSTQPPVKTPQVNNQSHGRVALFTGCTQTIFDRQAINSASQLLASAGFEVVIPEQQACCGALHASEGQFDTAQQLLQQNTRIFTEASVDYVLYLSSGCGAHLVEQQKQAGFETNVAYVEITRFLHEQAVLDKLDFEPLNKTIAVHLPCSQKNVLRQEDTASLLLQHIPQLKTYSLEQHGCCGAGGTTMLKHRQLANAVRQPLLDDIHSQSGIETVVTTNPGCQLHLQDGLKEMNVIHPVSLLARQYRGER